MSPLPIIMLILCVFAAGGYYYYNNIYLPKKQKREEEEMDTRKQSTWEYINVKDIGENAIYTVDNKIIAIFRITPINIDLMTDEEKENATTFITAHISGVRDPYKILSIQKPYDIAPYISDLMKKYKESDEIRKRIIMKEVAALNELGSSSEITDRQCFLVYWNDNNRKFEQKRNAFAKCFDEADVSLELLDTKQLIRLCNMVYNPSFKMEIRDPIPSVPVLKI